LQQGAGLADWEETMPKERDVVYVERGDASAKWFLWGAIAGAAIAVLYAPATGEQTRRGLQRRLRKLRAMAEEKVDELVDELGSRRDQAADWIEETADDFFDDDEGDENDELESVVASPRAEVEERLAQARARRRGVGEATRDDPI
jgi:gas vesicle protein